MTKKFEIRNSTAEFLIFMAEGKENGVQVVYKDETIWCTQKAMATLFDVDKSGISRHIKKILSEGELSTDTTVAKIATVVNRGIRGEVEDELEYYNLDMVIAVGYRVNSRRATQFRQWCTFVLRQYAIRGYVIDKKRMENGSFIGVDYFEQLLEEIREIRLSKRNFYQKLTDIYATAMDYDRNAETTRLFFAKVQNKLHYAVHRHTAAELIYERAASGKDHMGLTTWEKAPNGRILKSDVVIAKNYLTQDEVEELGRIVNAYLELAESRAKRHVPMTMEDWAMYLDKILSVDDRELLTRASEISAEIAQAHAFNEYEKFRVRQELEYKNDFDRQLDWLEEQAKKDNDSPADGK